MKSLLKTPGKYFLLSASVFFIYIAYLVFTSDYLLTDEAHLLWHNRDGSVVFQMFSSQGRYLTGKLFTFLYQEFDSIAAVKYIRLFSFFGWLASLFLFYGILKKCLSLIDMDFKNPLLYSCLFFISGSLSLTVFISWAACAEIFLAAVFGLYSGYAMFICLQQQKDDIHIPTTVYLKVILSGIISLFFYQSLYPVMLLPVFFQYVFSKQKWSNKKWLISLGFYFIIYGIYYVIFTKSTTLSGTAVSTRTNVHLAPLEKIAYFFSFPLNQAFNLNIPFDATSIVSQLVFPVLALLWLITVFFKSDRSKLSQTIGWLVGILFSWMLVFIPQMITSENFGPYRTMLVLSVFVFLTLQKAVFSLFTTENQARVFVTVSGIIFLAIGAHNYRRFIVDPLTLEYNLAKTAILNNYKPAIKKVVFIRPDENGFEKSLGITNHKDELGMPSTSKDWVPEPLVKEILFESGVSREILSKLEVLNMKASGISDSIYVAGPETLLIDMSEILAKLPK